MFLRIFWTPRYCMQLAQQYNIFSGIANFAAKKVAKSICPIYPEIIPIMKVASGLQQE